MPLPTARKTYYRFILSLFVVLFIQPKTYAQLTANFTIDKSTGCSPLTVSFTNTSTGTSANTTYKWDFGNGNTSALKNPGATYVTEKTYTVTLTATDGSSSSTQTGQVIVYKTPTVDFSASPLTGCIPLTANFTSNSTPGDGTIANYLWDFGDGNTQQGSGFQQISHTYTFAEEASVSLTVTNSYGCYNTTAKPAVNILAAISASFTEDKTVLCTTTDAVMFTNTSTGTGLTYLWDFGDGTTSTDISPSHTYNSKGTYQAKLTVSNNAGCSSTSTTQIINVANFTAAFTVPSLLCKTNSVTFTDNSTPGYTNETWQVDGSNAYNYYYSGFTYSFPTTGQHSVELTATYGDCSVSSTQQVTVNDIPAIKPFVINTASFCNPPVTVSFKDTSTGVTSWAWDFNYDYYNNTVDAASQAPSYTYNSQGNYEINLTVKNANGCTATETQNIDIFTPTVNIYPTFSGIYGTSGCGSETATFTASSTTQLTAYAWNFGDGTTSTAANPQHTFTTPGTYTVQLNYTTAAGCTGSTSYSSITIYKKPVANFTVSSTTTCGNSPVSFTDESTGTISYWDWNFGDNYNYYDGDGYDGYEETNPIIQYTDSGTYTVQLIVSNQSCSDTMTKTAYIRVNPPFPKISGAYNTCNGTRGLVKFTETSKYALSWSWNFGDGTSQTFTTKQDTVSHTYTKTGTYKVILTTTNGSCSVSDSMNVYVLLKQSPVLSSTQTTICGSDALNVTINNLEVNPSIYVYTYYDEDYTISNWQYGDGTLFPGYNSSDTYDWQTTYTGSINELTPSEQSLRAILTSTYFDCQDTTNYLPIKIKGPVAGFKITTNNACFKSPVIFQDTSYGTNNIGIKTWQWNFGDGTSETLAKGGTISHYYATPGYYYPTLTVTDSGGCSATSSTSYYSSNEAIVNGPQAAFYYSPTSVAPNTSIYFENNTNYQGSYNTQYLWSFGDGTTSTDYYPPLHSYPAIGADTVKLIADDPTTGCADTAIQVIYVKNVNTAFTYTISYINSSSCPPVIVRFTNTSVNATSVSWNFGDGSTAINQDYPSHTYLEPGVYMVTLYGYGIYGTVDSTTDSVTVKGPYAKLSTNTLGGCLAQTVTLSALVKNASSITWDFADGTIEQTQDTFAQHAYLTPGLYTPSLILKDSTGCSSTSSLGDTIVIDTLNISLNQVPNHFCDSAIVAFNPNIYSLAASQMNQALLYEWNFGTSNPADTSDNTTPSFDYNKLGEYYVNLKVTSPYGCVKQATDSIFIVQRSKGSITGPADICQGKSAIFTGAATIINSNTSWNWDFYNGNNSILQNPPTQVYSDSGTYNISLIVNNNGCSDTSYNKLIVHAQPVIDLTPKQTTICLGKSVTLTAHDGNIYSWVPVTNLNNSSSATVIASPLVNTTYSVTVANTFGCVNIDSSNITVAKPFKMIAPADTTICNGKTVQLNISGANSYNWINATTGLNDTRSGNPIGAPQSTIIYTVVGYDAYQCFSDTASIKITVEPVPTVNAGQDVQTLIGTPVQLNATGSSDITGWNWSPPNYLSCTNCPSPVSTPENAITYLVTASNQYGCTASGQVVISLICTQQFVYIPTAFTPNGDGKNDIFYVMGKGMKTINSLQIFNRWGVLVFERNNINIGDQSAGWDGTYQGAPVPADTYVYLVKMECDTGEAFERKGTIVLIR